MSSTGPAPEYLPLLDVLERGKKGERFGETRDGRHFMARGGEEIAPSAWRNLDASKSVREAKATGFTRSRFVREFELVVGKPKKARR